MHNDQSIHLIANCA